MNSVIWCILNSSIGRYLCNDDPAYPVCAFFAKVVAGDRRLKTSPEELRDLFPHMAIGQHDVKEFYEELVNMLPRNIRNRMTFEKSTYTVCLKCREVSITDARIQEMHEFRIP